MPLQKWKLLSTKDISPSKWFPIELRSYELPNGKIVDDFTVTTLADVAMILPLTADNKAYFVRQFKPGIGEVVIELPAGRIEKSHKDVTETAQHELEEETGIKVSTKQLHSYGKFFAFPTKGSEIVNLFLAENCEVNSQQHFDENEDIEVLLFSQAEVDKMTLNGEIWGAQTIAAWELAKKKFPEKFLGN